MLKPRHLALLLGAFTASCGSDPVREPSATLPDAGLDTATTASCEGITCWTPPPATCSADGTLQVAAPGGYCTNGECEYATRPQACSVGTCQDGQCSESACEGVTSNRCDDQRSPLTSKTTPGKFTI